MGKEGITKKIEDRETNIGLEGRQSIEQMIEDKGEIEYKIEAIKRGRIEKEIEDRKRVIQDGKGDLEDRERQTERENRK